jgi:hypothetical protein
MVSPFDGVLLNVQLTKGELQACPLADSAIPVSLQQKYRGRTLLHMAYSTGNLINGGPVVIPPLKESTNNISDDPHLRSCKCIAKYDMVGKDGPVGAIQDLLFDDSMWLIRFIVGAVDGIIDCVGKLFGPPIIEDIEWSTRTVKIAATRKQALAKPYFIASRHLDISFEVLVKDLYDLQKEDNIFSH